MLRINPDRLLSDLRYLRSVGTYKTGVHRPTLSAEDIYVRKWLVERMREADLNADIDGIGNILGTSRKEGPIVLSGSHIETQNYAGWLDGALGVIYALECARAVKEAGSQPGGVDVTVFCDEEGHFGSFLGSRSFIGVLNEVEIDSARNVTTGMPLREALKIAGYEGRPRFVIDPSRYVGFFEAHIEQGRVLETAEKKIGIVSAIVGFWQYRILVEGEQNHAGTTPMEFRRDAGLALIKLLNAIDAKFRAFAGANTVWTTGRISFEPGARSIIPGQAEALFQFRDTDTTVLERLDKILHSLVGDVNKEGPCKLTLARISASQPAQMDPELVRLIGDSAQHVVPGLAIKMQSGAAHNSQYLATKLPTAMLLVPSIKGISHHWTEDTSDEDIVTGAEVFARAISLVLGTYAI